MALSEAYRDKISTVDTKKTGKELTSVSDFEKLAAVSGGELHLNEGAEALSYISYANGIKIIVGEPKGKYMLPFIDSVKMDSSTYSGTLARHEVIFGNDGLGVKFIAPRTETPSWEIKGGKVLELKPTQK